METGVNSRPNKVVIADDHFHTRYADNVFATVSF
jgi:hypothetical protein